MGQPGTTVGEWFEWELLYPLTSSLHCLSVPKKLAVTAQILLVPMDECHDTVKTYSYLRSWYRQVQTWPASLGHSFLHPIPHQTSELMVHRLRKLPLLALLLPQTSVVVQWSDWQQIDMFNSGSVVPRAGTISWAISTTIQCNRWDTNWLGIWPFTNTYNKTG